MHQGCKGGSAQKRTKAANPLCVSKACQNHSGHYFPSLRCELKLAGHDQLCVAEMIDSKY